MDFKERVSLFAAACEEMRYYEWRLIKQGIEDRLQAVQSRAMLSKTEELEKLFCQDNRIQRLINSEQREKQKQMD